MSDVPSSRPSGRPLPPPAPGGPPATFAPAAPPDLAHSSVDLFDPRAPQVGELTTAWRVALTVTWVLVFLGYLSVWKVSEEIGIGTWWLGPSSNPQPILVRLLPFIITAIFGALASFPLRRLPWINGFGGLLLLLFALPDFSRAAGLAVIELAIGGAVLVISAASLTGRYREPSRTTRG